MVPEMETFQVYDCRKIQQVSARSKHNMAEIWKGFYLIINWYFIEFLV